MSIIERADYALDLLRANTTSEGRPAAEHVFALAVETMIRVGSDYCALTTTEVERFVPAAGKHNATRIIRRVLDSGALVDVTGQPGYRLDSVSANSRIVRLPDARIGGPSAPIDAPQGAAIDGRGMSEGARIDGGGHPQHAAIDGGESPEAAAIDGQVIVTTNTTSNYNITNTTTTVTSFAREDSVPSAEEYIPAMSPRHRLWTNGELDSQAARVLGVVLTSPTPTTPATVCRVLNRDSRIGNRGAKDVLRNLGRHRLIIRAPEGPGWVPGPVTKETHNPATCVGCTVPVSTPAIRPASPDTTGAVLAPERGRQSPLRPSSEPTAAKLRSCRRCGAFLHPEYGCPSGCSESTPGPLRYRFDGTPVNTYPATGELFTAVGSWGWIAECDPSTGEPIHHRIRKPKDANYPHAIANARSTYDGR